MLYKEFEKSERIRKVLNPLVKSAQIGSFTTSTTYSNAFEIFTKIFNEINWFHKIEFIELIYGRNHRKFKRHISHKNDSNSNLGKLARILNIFTFGPFRNQIIKSLKINCIKLSH